jgi:hypothetical protein
MPVKILVAVAAVVAFFVWVNWSTRRNRWRTSKTTFEQKAAGFLRPALLIADVTTAGEIEMAMTVQADATLVLHAPWLDADPQRFDAGLVFDAQLLDEGLLPPVSPTASWSRLTVDPVVDAARAAFRIPHDRRRLVDMLRQPFHVATAMTGIPGERRTLATSITACRAALYPPA